MTYGQREVLAERMALKPVVGQNTPAAQAQTSAWWRIFGSWRYAQVGVALKVDTIEVPGFPLIPDCSLRLGLGGDTGMDIPVCA